MPSDVTIVGAGLSGLMAAHQLKRAGKNFTILDKGQSVGGRLASRRIGNGIADHGAQFFTVRTRQFKDQVEQWLADNLVYIWGHGWSDGSIKRSPDDGHPRYVSNGGMNALAKNLAESLEHIYVDSEVSNIVWNEGRWIVHTTGGDRFESKVVIMTPPVPQSLDLLLGLNLTDNTQAALERIQYGPCLCGLFVIDGNIDLPEPGALQNFESTVYWLADNKKKGISPKEQIITMHVEAGYSRTHYDDPQEEILDFLRKELQHYLTKGTSIKEEQLKKWRYSVPLTTHPQDCLVAENFRIIFAGDAFGGRGRVEGAYISGVKAGQTAISLLQS